MRTFAEGHRAEPEKSSTVHVYRFVRSPSSTSDSLTYVHVNETRPLPCTCGEERCLGVTFIWAPTFEAQLPWMQLIQAWAPDVVAMSPGNAYNKGVVVSPAWRAGWESILRARVQLRLCLIQWPYGGTPAARAAVLQTWEQAHPRRIAFFSQATWNRGQQGAHTWHFACGLTRTHAHSDTLVAYEGCTDVTDTATIRAVVTLAGW